LPSLDPLPFTFWLVEILAIGEGTEGRWIDVLNITRTIVLSFKVTWQIFRDEAWGGALLDEFFRGFTTPGRIAIINLIKVLLSSPSEDPDGSDQLSQAFSSFAEVDDPDPSYRAALLGAVLSFLRSYGVSAYEAIGSMEWVAAIPADEPVSGVIYWVQIWGLFAAANPENREAIPWQQWLDYVRNSEIPAIISEACRVFMSWFMRLPYDQAVDLSHDNPGIAFDVVVNNQVYLAKQFGLPLIDAYVRAYAHDIPRLLTDLTLEVLDCVVDIGVNIDPWGDLVRRLFTLLFSLGPGTDFPIVMHRMLSEILASKDCDPSGPSLLLEQLQSLVSVSDE
jgi:hypothetical protein